MTSDRLDLVRVFEDGIKACQWLTETGEDEE
jgi:hypothetical protein